MKNKSTSWGKVAEWYDNLVEKDALSYQQSLILPNLLRLVAPKNGDKIFDLACGQGFFAREFAKAGAKVAASDIAEELVRIAKELSKKAGADVEYHVSGADNISFIKDGSIDKITIVLALQNIENLNGTLAECARILKKGGSLFVVLNHPAFRIPKLSSWGWEGDKVQYRRIDQYMTESKTEIAMHPGNRKSETTVSFHRPLQVYFKTFKKNGLAVTGLEEWISNKKSEPGPRAKAEDKARKEIPLFMMVEAIKI